MIFTNRTGFHGKGFGFGGDYHKLSISVEVLKK